MRHDIEAIREWHKAEEDYYQSQPGNPEGTWKTAHADRATLLSALDALPGLLAIRNAAKTALGYLDDPTGGDEINDMRRASDVLRIALKGT